MIQVACGCGWTGEKEYVECENHATVRRQRDALLDACKNMIGVFDNPAMRLKVDNEWTREAIDSARMAIKAVSGETPWIPKQ